MTFASFDAIGAVTPDVAFKTMADESRSMMVDVRTRPEWMFVGTADLSSLGRPQCFIEWLGFPAMSPNARFLEALAAEIDAAQATTVFFLCRSGARSHDASVATAEFFRERGQKLTCVNVLEGFEGPLDGQGHRGALAGWKARGLPWRQN